MMCQLHSEAKKPTEASHMLYEFLKETTSKSDSKGDSSDKNAKIIEKAAGVGCW
jgi:hypothetical protein